MGEEIERFLFEISEIGGSAFELELAELIGEVPGGLEEQG